MLYKKLDSPFDLDELYDIWCDIIKYSCYPLNENISDKYFSFLNEYYSNPVRTFSNWNLIYNSIDYLNSMPHGKLSVKNKDLLMLGIFFGFIHFDASSCTGFEKSAYESLDMLDRLGLSEDEMRYIFSHIASLDYAFIYDEEKSFSYHCMRDSCFYWLHNKPEDYIQVANHIRKESKYDSEDWNKNRRLLITSALESEKLMHAEEISSTGLHLVVQNNLLDELNILNKENKISASA
jgi:hypothetical protein